MGRLPIHIAAVHSSDRLSHLVEAHRLKKIPLSTADMTVRTVLHWAAQSGDVKAIDDILSAQVVDIDQGDRDDWTALCWAARGLSSKAKFDKTPQDQAEVVKYLLKGGANVEVEC
ncbi:hypothetical protein BDP81DRAFT_441195 [Colletotrichum phormii]|uniref:Ankyrin repeat protein n=1 Tax=Colletotrichum phormii TaxID=359342 RepID=A0AAI9ZDD0_9PEZI|nr:uncharacterized protein BDP81DRAFT_441195 [Colletotrichum phormii]KAK1622433.1 hypothetical protein BDP81DRAFT_441195 [Colletotrichum phormii]